MEVYAGTKEIALETLERHASNAEHQLIIRALIQTTVQVGEVAEISGFLAKSEDGSESGVTFAVRTKKPHPERPGKYKWGTPHGEGWLSFESIETMFGSLQPSPDQRIAFRKNLREAILAPPTGKASSS